MGNRSISLKRIYLILTVSLSMTAIGLADNSQMIEKQEIPQEILIAIEKAYPEATINAIEKELIYKTTYYEFEISDKNGEKDLIYLEDGTLHAIEEEIPAESLPKKLSDFLMIQFPGGEIDEVDKITIGDEISYEVIIKIEETNNETEYEILITSDGKIKKTEKLSDDSDDDEVDDGPNDLLNYPVIDSILMNPDSSFTVWGTAPIDTRVEFYVSHPADDSTRPTDTSGHSDANSYLGFTYVSNTKEPMCFLIPNSVPPYSQITATATDEFGNTSQFSPNQTLIPRPLIIVGYSLMTGKSYCPSVVDIKVTDPQGRRIGYDVDNIWYDEIPDAEYHKTIESIDSVYISYPIMGEYTIEVVADTSYNPDPDNEPTYTIGVQMDGSLQCVQAEGQLVPAVGATDSYNYNDKDKKAVENVIEDEGDSKDD